jgi:catalase
MTYHHKGAQPVYAPNSYGGPRADPDKEPPTWYVEAAEIGRYVTTTHRDDDDFGQAQTLYRQVMSETDRDHLATNIIDHAGNGVTGEIQQRVIGYWSNVDPQLGARVAAGLGHGNGSSQAEPGRSRVNSSTETGTR